MTQIRVDILFDTLSTEIRYFEDLLMAKMYALSNVDCQDVLEVQINGKKIEPWNYGRDTI